MNGPRDEAPTAQTLLPSGWGGRRREVTGSMMGPSYLVPIAGPPHDAMVLDPGADKGGGLVLGRQEGVDLRLSGAEQVSRRHARFRWNAERGRWSVSDAGSSWGTYVNGRRLEKGELVPLGDGDLVRITPWTFLLSPTPAPRGLQLRGEPDDPASRVQRVREADLPPMQQERLALLLNSAAELQQATDERDLAARLLRLAQEGTQLGNGVVLRPVNAEGRYNVLASRNVGNGRGTAYGDEAPVSFSRSLLAAARRGEVAEVRADNLSASGLPSLTPVSASIVQMQITRAVCVPVMLGDSVSLLLYLDQRGETFVAGADQEGATAFCLALGKIASLALANLKRLEMERRTAEIDADLKAAAAAQQWILPNRELELCGYRITGESRPGRGVGGDFFDAIELGRGRLAVALGDVSGKGITAGVLMTATQGFLHAILDETCGCEGPPDVALAVERLSRFVHPRRPSTRFVTLWVGVFDAQARTLTYVDAGHGLGTLRTANGHVRDLTGGGGLPVGILPDADYVADTVEIEPGDAVLIVSDGIVEQPSGSDNGGRDEFDMLRARRVLLSHGDESSGDLVTHLFDAVIEHAGTEQLADDATAVYVRA